MKLTFLLLLTLMLSTFAQDSALAVVALEESSTTLVSSGLNGPTGVAVDGHGNVYIADYGNNAIRQWSAATQEVTTLISSGLNGPFGIAVDGSGDIYIADERNNAVKKWSAATQQVTTYRVKRISSAAAPS